MVTMKSPGLLYPRTSSIEPHCADVASLRPIVGGASPEDFTQSLYRISGADLAAMFLYVVVDFAAHRRRAVVSEQKEGE